MSLLRSLKSISEPASINRSSLTGLLQRPPTLLRQSVGTIGRSPLNFFSKQRNLPMKRISILILLAVALSPFASAQKKAAGAKPNRPNHPSTAKPSPAATRAQEQLKKLEEDWAQAFIKRDAAALKGLLADDYVVIDPNGNVGDKASTLADSAAGDI